MQSIINWVDVHEKLPAERVPVLLGYITERGNVQLHYDTWNWRDGKWIEYRGDQECHWRVDFWAPMPEPVKVTPTNKA